MKSVVLFALVLVLSVVSSSVVGVSVEESLQSAGSADTQWSLFSPQQVAWKDGPPSLSAGAKFAVLEGDLSKDGFFTMRIQVPDGYRVAPHWHPKQERLTVISGTLNLGMGDRFDPGATKALAAGSYSSMPPKMTHFAWAKGQTVIQLSSIGPWDITYVNPADDPRNKK